MSSIFVGDEYLEFLKKVEELKKHGWKTRPIQQPQRRRRVRKQTESYPYPISHFPRKTLEEAIDYARKKISIAIELMYDIYKNKIPWEVLEWIVKRANDEDLARKVRKLKEDLDYVIVLADDVEALLDLLKKEE